MKRLSYGIFKLLIDLSESDITNVSEYFRKQNDTKALCGLFKWLNILEKNGFIRTRKEGRTKIISLTRKGVKEAELLSRSHLIKLWMRGRI